MDLVVVGGAGHGREILDLVWTVDREQSRWADVGVVDDDPSRSSLVEAAGAMFVGGLDALEALPDVDAVLGIGSEAVRRQLDERFSGAQRRWPQLVHPAASVGRGNDLGPGAVVFAGARITTNVRLGRHTHVNVNASVSHDCVVGDHSTISPGAVVAGSCAIGDRVLVGAGATVLQGRTIGDGAVIGAGAVVVDDVPAGATVVGVPAGPLVRR